MKKTSHPWLMLILRSLLFLGFQAMIALAFLVTGSQTAWDDSAAWWMFTVILADLVGLALLVRAYKLEGDRFWDIFRLDKKNIKRDLFFMLGFLVVLAPVSFLPNIWSAKWLFGDVQIALGMLVRPLPLWASVFGLLFFPLLQGLVEIPTYTLYALPRLEERGIRPWLAVMITSAFLSAQHIFVPFLPDGRFIFYRLLMFLPFAVLVVVVMRWRPRLMPYMAVIHVLMDFSAAVMFLLI